MKPEDEEFLDGSAEEIAPRDRERLHDLIDGRLAEQEVAALHQRLEHEPALRQALNELRLLGTLLRDEWEAIEPPALDPLHLADRVLARTLAAVPASSLPHREAPERLSNWELHEPAPMARPFPWVRVSGLAAAAVVVVGTTWFIWNQWTKNDYGQLLPPTRSEARISEEESARVDLKDAPVAVSAERAKAREKNDFASATSGLATEAEEVAEEGIGITNKNVGLAANPEAEALDIEGPSVFYMRNEDDEPMPAPPVATPNQASAGALLKSGIADTWRGLGEFFGAGGLTESPETAAQQLEIPEPAVAFDKLAEERLERALRMRLAAEAPVEAEETRALERASADLNQREVGWREEDRQALRELARIVVDRYEVVATAAERGAPAAPDRVEVSNSDEAELEAKEPSDSESYLALGRKAETATDTPRLLVDQSHLRAAVAWNALQSEWTRVGTAVSKNPPATAHDEVKADREVASAFVLSEAPAEDVLVLKLTVEPGHAAVSLGQTIESLGLRAIAPTSTPVRKAQLGSAIAAADETLSSELYIGWLNTAPAEDVPVRDADASLRFIIDPLLEGRHAVAGSVMASATIQLALVQAVQEAEVDQWLVQADPNKEAQPRLKDEFALAGSSPFSEQQPAEQKLGQSQEENARARAKSAEPTRPPTPGAASRVIPFTPGAPPAPKNNSGPAAQTGAAGGGGPTAWPPPELGTPVKPFEQLADPATELQRFADHQQSLLEQKEALKALEIRLAKAVRERVSASPLRVMVVLEQQSDQNASTPRASEKKPKDK